MPSHENETNRPDSELLQAMRELGLRCPFCEYDLRGAAGVRCPECGRALTWMDFQSDRQMPSSGFVVLAYYGTALWIAVFAVMLPVLLTLRASLGAIRGPLALVVFIALVCSIVLLCKWTMRPRRLLMLGGGARTAALLVLVIPGAVFTVALIVAILLVISTVLGLIVRLALG